MISKKDQIIILSKIVGDMVNEDRTSLEIASACLIKAYQWNGLRLKSEGINESIDFLNSHTDMDVYCKISRLKSNADNMIKQLDEASKEDAKYLN